MGGNGKSKIRTFKCIYCQNEFARDGFSKEHVIPQLLGTFEQNLTLINTVCKDCNNYFGRVLEPVLAVGSWEGIQRLREHLGDYSPRVTDLLDTERVAFRYDGTGPHRGILLAPSYRDGELQVGLVPQVGFKSRKTGEFGFVPIWDLRKHHKQLPPESQKHRGILLVCRNTTEKDLLVWLLATRGIKYPKKVDWIHPIVLDQKPNVEINSMVDSVYRRSIAKIAFNYLAKSMESTDRQFIHSADFDPARRFIRYGDDPGYNVVAPPSHHPVLSDDSPFYRIPKVHVVSRGWVGPWRNSIMVRVSPFNTLTYNNLLCQHFSGIWREIIGGHIFNWHRKKISKVTAVSRRLLP